jgi:hypothetical protein
MKNSFDRFLENALSMRYDAVSHLINLLSLVGYLVSGVIVYQHFDATLTKGSDNLARRLTHPKPTPLD